MAEFIDREELVRQIICSMAEFIGAPDDVQKHDEQCNYAINMIEDAPAADMEPVVHARWIARSGKGIISITHPYMCSRCWRVEMDKEPYCNCGAKMDRGNDNALD